MKSKTVAIASSLILITSGLALAGHHGHGHNKQVHHQFHKHVMHHTQQHHMHPTAAKHYHKLNRALHRLGRADLLKHYYALPYGYYNRHLNSWVAAANGKVPLGAKTSSYRQNLPLYRCRVASHHRFVPGQLIPGRGCVIKNKHMNKTAHHYDVFVQ